MRDRRVARTCFGVPIRRMLKAMGVLVGLVALVAATPGCREQQLEEENLALKRQMEEALVRNAELQGELDRLRAAPPPAVPEEVAAVAPPVEGAPKPDFGPEVEVRTTAETMTVTLPDKVLFDSGSATLKSGSKSVLDKVAVVLNRDYPNHMIRVEGHTDDQPIRRTKKLWQDNWDLACNRAMAVVRYLESRGVDPKRLYAAGFSYHQPVASNATPAGRAKNRRVEIVVKPR